MANVTLDGSPIETVGELPAVGNSAPDFTLVKTDLSQVTLADYAGKQLILNIFPSVDTPTCAASVRAFNESAANVDNTVVLCVSADLPFAFSRFCGAEKLNNVETASTFRSPEFGKDYGVEFSTGPLLGLLSRAIVVIDGSGKILHTQQVKEIADEPDYAAALAVL